MAMMIDNKTLRLEPDGVKTDVIAFSGTEVEILETKGAWTKVRLKIPFLGAAMPEGWVLSEAIDAAATPATPVLKRENFADECVLDGLFFDVSAHYLMAVAELRSGISLGKQKNEIGPFRLLTTEWESFRKDEKFDLSFAPDDIASWRSQCAVFALMTLRALEGLTEQLGGRRPNSFELYLAQLIGPKAAAAALAAPTTGLDAVLKGVAEGDLPVGGLSPNDLLDRYKSFLMADTKAAKARVALERLEKALDDALSKTRDLALAAEAGILDTANSPATASDAPEAVLLHRPDVAGAAPLRGHLVQKMQAALIDSKHMPPADPSGKPTNDGVFGSGTVAALQKWQAENNFGANGVLTNAQWTKLTTAPSPDIYERCAQLTAGFEGTGFGGLNSTNFDKTGLTFGYHGYTLSGGNLQRFLRSMDTKNPNSIDAAFGGGKAATLRNLLKLSDTGAANAAATLFYDASGKILPEWRDAFRAFGETAECKQEQLEFSRATYWADAETFRAALGLSEPLSHALCFDVAVQNGKKLPVAKAVAKAFTPEMSEMDKRKLFGEAIANASLPQFQNDVRKRKVDTLSTGSGEVHKGLYRLDDWGFAPPESGESDQPTHEAPPSDNADFDAWFKKELPGYTAFSSSNFLYKGGSHQTNHLNSDPPQDLWPNIKKLAKVLAELKQRLGNPTITFNSVYRNRRYNESVGGARSSQHMRFTAADIVIHNGKGPRDWAQELHAMRNQGVFSGGIGVYSSFVHVDTRGQNADW